MQRMTNFRSAAIATGNAINDSAYDNVKIVADDISNVNTVGTALNAGTFDVAINNIDDIVTVANNIADVITVAGIEVEIQSIAADKVTLDSIYADKATLDSLFADKATLDSLFTDKATLDSLYADKTTLDRLFTSIDNIDTVAGSISNINTTATDITNINTVAIDITNINSIATTVVPNIDEILQADDNAAIATTKAGEALASAGNASTSETNALASADKAEKWAEEAEDVEVETGKYSAKHWAAKAEDWVIGSTIDDITPQIDKSYSGNKVEAELLERDNRLDTAEIKLDTIETGATADQTGVEIKSLYEAEADTNPLTDIRAAKVDATTLSGKGITDAYTKEELDSGQLDNRYYTETELDALLALKASLTGATFTGQVKGITPVSTEDLTRKDYVDAQIDLTKTSMSKAAFNALARDNRDKFAGSGFVEWGKGHSTLGNINEGMYDWAGSRANVFSMGRGETSQLGTSKTDEPIVGINGTSLHLKKVASQATTTLNDIFLPTAPTVTHADASNSGLILNGKFDTDISGWTVRSPATITWNSGVADIARNLGSFTSQPKVPVNFISGKKYIVEVTITTAPPSGNFTMTTLTSDGLTVVDDIAGTSTTTVGRKEYEFIATSNASFLLVGVGNNSSSTVSVDNIAVFPADEISRTDLTFLESWHEDISEKGIVYPLGNVQYLGADTDGLTGIANGAFTGFGTYSLFGSWQASSALIGKGYVWANLTDAQKKAFLANPENNCYLDGNKVIQVRYRMRTQLGVSDTTTMSIATVQGKATVPSAVLYTAPVTTVDAGLYSNTSTTYGYDGKTYAIEVALVHRRNQGAYHPVFNANGTRKYWYANDQFRDWYYGNIPAHINSIADTFNITNADGSNYQPVGDWYSGRIGTSSGRPDGLFYDQVHESDILDLRMSSQKVQDYNRLIDREFNRAVSGEVRGLEGEIETVRHIDTFTVDEKGFTGYTYTATRLVDNGNAIFGEVITYGSSTSYEHVGYIQSNTTYYKVGFVVSGGNSVIYLSPYHGDVSADFTVGNTYKVIVFAQSIRTKSNTLTHCDIIGSPANYPASWKESGVFGTPLLVGESGESLLPTGTTGSDGLATFKLSRKANATPLQVLKSTDSGATWTALTVSTHYTFSTTTNAITFTAGNIPLTTHLVRVDYQTHTNMAEPTVNSEVLAIGDVQAMNRYLGNSGNYLQQTLINKIGISNSIPYNPNTNITSWRLDTTAGNKLESYPQPTHDAFLMSSTSSPIAVKTFPYLTRENGKAYLNLVFKEMKFDVDWGDDSKFNIIDNVSTTTDDNANAVLIGQKRIGLPYFISEAE